MFADSYLLRDLFVLKPLLGVYFRRFFYFSLLFFTAAVVKSSQRWEKTLSFLKCSSGGIVVLDQTRSPLVKVWYLISVATFYNKKTRNSVYSETPKRYKTSVSVAYLVSTSSLSWQVLEMLSNLKCHQGRSQKKSYDWGNVHEKHDWGNRSTLFLGIYGVYDEYKQQKR